MFAKEYLVMDVRVHPQTEETGKLTNTSCTFLTHLQKSTFVACLRETM